MRADSGPRPPAAPRRSPERTAPPDRPGFVPLERRAEVAPDEMLRRAREFRRAAARRRTVRHFSDRPVPVEVVMECVRAAGTAPSGANHQPWHFVVVSDPAVKSRIRAAAEEEERAFYRGGAPQEWLDDLAALGTDEHKPFLEAAPHLVAIFAERYRVLPGGGRAKNYYVQESVGIATGILIAGLHRAGLATLTHTPSPMAFLNEILGRPRNERPFLLLVTGRPAPDATVPAISRKAPGEIATFL